MGGRGTPAQRVFQTRSTAALQPRLLQQNFLQALNDDLGLVIPEGFRKDNQKPARSKALINRDDRVAVLKRIDHVPSRHSDFFLVNSNMCFGNRSSTTAGIDKTRFDSVQPCQSPHDCLNSGTPSPELSLQISLLVKLERRQQPDDLFFGCLEPPSQAVMGRALDESLGYRWR